MPVGVLIETELYALLNFIPCRANASIWGGLVVDCSETAYIVIGTVIGYD